MVRKGIVNGSERQKWVYGEVMLRRAQPSHAQALCESQKAKR
jgi:hypothetical protein